MENKTVFVHVGMPKTGTTYLQEQVFPYIKGVHFWRDTNCDEYTAYIKSIQFGNPSQCHWPEHGQRIRQYMESFQDDRILISDESLCGGVLGGIHLNFSNFNNCASILKQVFPEAKLIMTIRRQDAYLESLYRQSLKQGYSQTINRFLNWDDSNFGSYKPYGTAGPNIDVRSLQYGRYIDTYAGMFGRDNVLVLPQELLLTQPEAFNSRVTDFMGASLGKIPEPKSLANVSYSYRACRVAIVCNEWFRFPFRRGGVISAIPFQKHFLNRELNALEKVLFKMSKPLSYYSLLHFISRHDRSDKKFITDDVAKNIRAIYKESNERLSRDIGIDLSQFGYN